MTIQAVIYFVIIGLLLLITTIYSLLQKTLIKMLEKKIYDDRKYYHDIQKYCLLHILKDYVDKEDYDMAAKVKEWVDELEKREQNATIKK